MFDTTAEAITSRGKPAADDVVHRRVPMLPDGTRDEYPLCGNGSYHVRWTAYNDKVTCRACLFAIEAVSNGYPQGDDADMPDFGDTDAQYRCQGCEHEGDVHDFTPTDAPHGVDLMCPECGSVSVFVKGPVEYKALGGDGQLAPNDLVEQATAAIIQSCAVPPEVYDKTKESRSP